MVPDYSISLIADDHVRLDKNRSRAFPSVQPVGGELFVGVEGSAGSKAPPLGSPHFQRVFPLKPVGLQGCNPLFLQAFPIPGQFGSCVYTPLGMRKQAR